MIEGRIGSPHSHEKNRYSERRSAYETWMPTQTSTTRRCCGLCLYPRRFTAMQTASEDAHLNFTEGFGSLYTVELGRFGGI